jgi:hypothetical protein
LGHIHDSCALSTPSTSHQGTTPDHLRIVHLRNYHAEQHPATHSCPMVNHSISSIQNTSPNASFSALTKGDQRSLLDPLFDTSILNYRVISPLLPTQRLGPPTKPPCPHAETILKPHRPTKPSARLHRFPFPLRARVVGSGSRGPGTGRWRESGPGSANQT